MDLFLCPNVVSKTLLFFVFGRSQNTEKDNQPLSLANIDNLKFPGNLMCMFLGGNHIPGENLRIHLEKIQTPH